GVLRGMYRSPAGRDYARRMAFHKFSPREAIGHQFPLAAIEALSLGTVNGLVSLQEYELIRQLSDGVYQAYLEGRFTESGAFAAFVAFNGDFGPRGWEGLHKAVDPKLRGMLAYFFSHRFRRLSKPAEADALLRLAREEARPGTALLAMLDEEDSP